MLDVKKLLTKVLERLLVRYERTYVLPAVSAGARGYWNLSISIPANAIIASVQTFTSQIAASNAVQITPIYVNATNVCLNYYAPAAIPANTVTLRIYISYWGGYFITSILSTIGRWWRYVRCEETDDQNTYCIENTTKGIVSYKKYRQSIWESCGDFCPNSQRLYVCMLAWKCNIWLGRFNIYSKYVCDKHKHLESNTRAKRNRRRNSFCTLCKESVTTERGCLPC